MYVVQRHTACHTTMKTTLIACSLVAAAVMGVEAQPPATATENFHVAPTTPPAQRIHPPATNFAETHCRRCNSASHSEREPMADAQPASTP